MLWDVFGNHLDKVPMEEVFNLSEPEVDAFTSMKHHSFEISLAMISRGSMPSSEVSQRYSEWRVIESINKVADRCDCVKELAQIDKLRSEINSY